MPRLALVLTGLQIATFGLVFGCVVFIAALAL